MTDGGTDQRGDVTDVTHTDELLTAKRQRDGDLPSGPPDEEVEVSLGGPGAVDVLRPDEGVGQARGEDGELHLPRSVVGLDLVRLADRHHASGLLEVSYELPMSSLGRTTLYMPPLEMKMYCEARSGSAVHQVIE